MPGKEIKGRSKRANYSHGGRIKKLAAVDYMQIFTLKDKE